MARLASFREFVNQLERDCKLVKVNKPVSKRLEASGVLVALGERPVLFEHIKESGFRVETVKEAEPYHYSIIAEL